MAPELSRRLAVARGDEPADLVVRGGKVFSAFTREWLEVDVAVVDGYVAGLGSYEGEETLDAGGGYVVPGFVDAHMHLESSKLLVDEFARLVLPFGTTAVVADPHEIANVLGTDGVHWLLDVCGRIPLDVWFMASSCVPASSFESPRRELTSGDLDALLRRRRVLGLAEMMNFPGVIHGDARELAKLGLAQHVDGHAPGVLGRDLNAYIAAGIRSDHEAYTPEEGRERLQLGMWLLIREGSAARNLQALLPLLAEYGPSRIAFCTDDREPEHIADDGHINSMVRDAVAAGIPPEDALVCATLNPASWHGLSHLGAVAPGYQADLLLLPNLERFVPDVVLKSGRPVAEIPRAEVPDWVRQTVRVGALGPEMFRIPWSGGRARVIGLVPGQIVTESLVEEPTVRAGEAIADPARDLAKIAVIERHLATGRIGLGFVRGFGLERGALASTVAHDAHNVVVVGMSDAAMAFAVRRLANLGGGIVAVDGSEVVAELPLPVAGLLSDGPLEDVVARSRALVAAARELGCAIEAPFQLLAFLALSVIPSLKLTDRGLVDVDRFELVPLGNAVILANAWIVTMDDAGTEHERGWLRIEDGLVAALGPGYPPSPSDVAIARGEPPKAPPRVGQEPPATRQDHGPESGSGASRPLQQKSDSLSTGGPGGQAENDEVRDLRGAVVTPGLVNTHHHLYQTLTRARAQEADLFTWLRTLYPTWARIDAEMEYAAARTGLAELALSGCSTVFDHHYVFPRGVTGLIEAELQAARELGLRMVASRGSMDLGASDGGLPPDELAEDMDAILADTERLAALADGDLVGLAVAPCSPFSVTTRLMEESAALARRLGLQLHTHLAETVEEEAYCQELYGCTPVEYLQRVGWLDGDVWCAHCVHLSPAEIERFAASGVGVAHCPTSNLRLGAGTAPVRELLDAGARVGLGVDGSASNERSDMCFELKQALLAARGRGGGTAMTARDALRLGTRGSAAVLNRTDIGSLEPGKRADVAIWRTDGLELGGAEDLPAALVLSAPHRVDTLLVGGREIVRDGRLAYADEGEIAREHRRQAARLWRVA